MIDPSNLNASPHHHPSRPNVDYVPLNEATPRYKRLGKIATELMVNSLTDPLTGLANEKAFMSRLDLAVEREGQHNVPNGTDTNIVLLDVDVDGFKAVNDTLGHPVGDEILRVVASGLRASDFAARPHGDEFKVLIPDIEEGVEDKTLTREERIAAVRDRTRNLVGSALAASKYADKLAGLGVGISIGAVAYKHGEAIEDFLKRADDAMYADKHSRKAGR